MAGVDLDALMAEYREGVIEALAENARRAHIVGDLLSQRKIRRAARHITNAKKSSDYDYTPPTREGIMRIRFEGLAKEADAYLDGYTQLLTEKGGSIIDGKFVPWLEDHVTGVRQDIADAIAESLREGESSRTLTERLGEVIDGERYKLERIARSEMARVQTAGAVNRYKDAGVDRVRRLLGPNPCPDCLADADGEYPVDECPGDHPNGCCDWAPIVNVPPPEDYLMDEDQIAALLDEVGYRR